MYGIKTSNPQMYRKLQSTEAVPAKPPSDMFNAEYPQPKIIPLTTNRIKKIIESLIGNGRNLLHANWEGRRARGGSSVLSCTSTPEVIDDTNDKINSKKVHIANLYFALQALYQEQDPAILAFKLHMYNASELFKYNKLNIEIGLNKARNVCFLIMRHGGKVLPAISMPHIIDSNDVLIAEAAFNYWQQNIKGYELSLWLSAPNYTQLQTHENLMLISNDKIPTVLCYPLDEPCITKTLLTDPVSAIVLVNNRELYCYTNDHPDFDEKKYADEYETINDMKCINGIKYVIEFSTRRDFFNMSGPQFELISKNAEYMALKLIDGKVVLAAKDKIVLDINPVQDNKLLQKVPKSSGYVFGEFKFEDLDEETYQWLLRITLTNKAFIEKFLQLDGNSFYLRECANYMEIKNAEGYDANTLYTKKMAAFSNVYPEISNFLWAQMSGFYSVNMLFLGFSPKSIEDYTTNLLQYYGINGDGPKSPLIDDVASHLNDYVRINFADAVAALRGAGIDAPTVSEYYGPISDILVVRQSLP